MAGTFIPPNVRSSPRTVQVPSYLKDYECETNQSRGQHHQLQPLQHHPPQPLQHQQPQQQSFLTQPSQPQPFSTPHSTPTTFYNTDSFNFSSSNTNSNQWVVPSHLGDFTSKPDNANETVIKLLEEVLKNQCRLEDKYDKQFKELNERLTNLMQVPMSVNILPQENCPGHLPQSNNRTELMQWELAAKNNPQSLMMLITTSSVRSVMLQVASVEFWSDRDSPNKEEFQQTCGHLKALIVLHAKSKYGKDGVISNASVLKMFFDRRHQMNKPKKRARTDKEATEVAAAKTKSKVKGASKPRAHSSKTVPSNLQEE